MNNFIIAFIVPPMITGIGWGMYLFFAVWLFLGALFVWFFVPETKNKTLEEMDLVFGSITGYHDREMLAAVRDEVGLTALLRGEIGHCGASAILSVKDNNSGVEYEKVV